MRTPRQSLCAGRFLGRLLPPIRNHLPYPLTTIYRVLLAKELGKRTLGMRTAHQSYASAQDERDKGRTKRDGHLRLLSDDRQQCQWASTKAASSVYQRTSTDIVAYNIVYCQAPLAGECSNRFSIKTKTARQKPGALSGGARTFCLSRTTAKPTDKNSAPVRTTSGGSISQALLR